MDKPPREGTLLATAAVLGISILAATLFGAARERWGRRGAARGVY
jgi:hypothetical protein